MSLPDDDSSGFRIQQKHQLIRVLSRFNEYEAQFKKTQEDGRKQQNGGGVDFEEEEECASQSSSSSASSSFSSSPSPNNNVQGRNNNKKRPRQSINTSKHSWKTSNFLYNECDPSALGSNSSSHSSFSFSHSVSNFDFNIRYQYAAQEQLETLRDHPIVKLSSTDIELSMLKETGSDHRFSWDLCRSVLLRDSPIQSSDIAYLGDLCVFHQAMKNGFSKPDFRAELLAQWPAPMTFDRACRQWIALHYSIAYVRVDTIGSVRSLAGLMYFLRHRYLDAVKPVDYQALHAEYQREHQKYLEENVQSDTHGPLYRSAALGDDVPGGGGVGDGKDYFSTLTSDQARPFLKILTKDQQFWVRELERWGRQLLHWSTYTPCTSTVAHMLSFWDSYLTRLDFLSNQLFIKERLLETNNALSVEWFERCARWDHYVSLQLYYLKSMSVNEMQLNPEILETLHAKLQAKVHISNEANHLTKLREFVLQQHVPSFLTYELLCQNPNFYETFFNSKFEDHVFDCDLYETLNRFVPKMLAEYTAHYFYGTSLQKIFHNEKSFLYDWSILKAFDIDTTHLIRGWMSKYVVSLFTLGSNKHWRIGERRSGLNDVTPVVVRLLGVTYVRTYIHSEDRHVLFYCKDAYHVIATFLYSLVMFHRSWLADETKLPMASVMHEWLPLAKFPTVPWNVPFRAWSSEAASLQSRLLKCYEQGEQTMARLQSIKEAETRKDDQRALEHLLQKQKQHKLKMQHQYHHMGEEEEEEESKTTPFLPTTPEKTPHPAQHDANPKEKWDASDQQPTKKKPKLNSTVLFAEDALARNPSLDPSLPIHFNSREVCAEVTKGVPPSRPSIRYKNEWMEKEEEEGTDACSQSSSLASERPISSDLAMFLDL